MEAARIQRERQQALGKPIIAAKFKGEYFVVVKNRLFTPSATASPCVFAEDTYYCSVKGPFTSGRGTCRASWWGPSKRRLGRRCGTCSTDWRKLG
jgi:hypothetical protein